MSQNVQLQVVKSAVIALTDTYLLEVNVRLTWATDRNFYHEYTLTMDTKKPGVVRIMWSYTPKNLDTRVNFARMAAFENYINSTYKLILKALAQNKYVAPFRILINDL